jgi:ERCC4-related helicase
MDYETFLESKRHSHLDSGIEPNYMPSELFEYQKFVAEKGIRNGRCAEFLDTGLGKTIIEIVTAKNYHTHTQKPVLIITPLAVAFQFIKETKIV